MDDQQYKRIVRIITALWFLMFVLLVGVLVISLTRKEVVTVNNSISKVGQKGDKGDPAPVDYPAIYAAIDAKVAALPPPLNGLNGKDGTNATSTQTIINTQTLQPVYTNVPVPGPKGDRGDKGDNGLQLIIKVDPSSCVLESQYQGDDGWLTLAQLPKPCKAQ